MIHLKNGSTIRADAWWEQGGEIRYRRAGGVVGIPKQFVQRIEPSERPAPATASAAADAAPAAPPVAAGALSRAPRAPTSSSPAPGPVAPDVHEVMLPAGASGPEGWRARLKAIEAAPGRQTGASREVAVLHTLLGNDAARSGDLETAESEYRLAIDSDPALAPALLNLARLRMVQGRNSEAEDLVRDALAARPGDPVSQSLLAEISYRSDRLPEAIELWETSLRARPDADVAARLQKAKKELAVEQDYHRSDAPHFTLKYDGDKASEDLTRAILDHLESTYGDLTSRFNVYPESVIIVTLYSREAFYDVTESPRWVGGLFDGQIRIPIGGLTRLSAQARTVFTHELTHAIVWHKTHGNCPKWLQEGIAQWVEGKSAGRHATDLARGYSSTGPAEVLEDFSYPMALSIVEHFLATWSFSHLLDLLTALGSGSDVESAFQATTGIALEEFIAGWQRQLPASGKAP